VNAHEHLDDRRSLGTFAERMARPASMLLLSGVRGCLASLHEGITAVRELGSRHAHGIALRRAVDLGVILGPRIVSCGRPIAPTGGYGLPLSVEADGDRLRKAARAAVRAGSDIVKLMASGGAATAPGAGPAPQFEERELRAVFDVARQTGRRTTVHANPAGVIRQCVEAGVDCIEHGRGLDQATARLMAERGVWLVPTLSELVVLEREGVSLGRRASQVVATGAARPQLLRGLQAALEAGVRVAAGLDVMGNMPLELELMVAAGMSAPEALVAATRGGAELMGLAGDIGTIEAGKRADLVAVRGDPTRRVSDVGNVALVVRDGQVWAPEVLERLVGTQVARWDEEHGQVFAESRAEGLLTKGEG
jgi:imidazolonepropionase-like amidohydrolase